jgi:hypothetical protein
MLRINFDKKLLGLHFKANPSGHPALMGEVQLGEVALREILPDPSKDRRERRVLRELPESDALAVQRQDDRMKRFRRRHLRPHKKVTD